MKASKSTSHLADKLNVKKRPVPRPALPSQASTSGWVPQWSLRQLDRLVWVFIEVKPDDPVKVEPTEEGDVAVDPIQASDKPIGFWLPAEVGLLLLVVSNV